MSTPVADLNHLVLASASDAPEVLIERLLVESARDFCKETKAWKYEQTGLTVALDTLEVALTPPADGELVDIVAAKLSSQSVPLGRRTWRQLDAEIGQGWRTNTPDLPPKYVLLSTNRDEVLIAPQADIAYTGELTVVAAYKPTLGATTLDDMLVSEYSNTIVNGALSKLLRVPGRGWSDPELANFYEQMYLAVREETKFTTNLGVRLA